MNFGRAGTISGNDAFRLCRSVLVALTVFAALAFRMTGRFVGRATSLRLFEGTEERRPSEYDWTIVRNAFHH